MSLDAERENYMIASSGPVDVESDKAVIDFDNLDLVEFGKDKKRKKSKSEVYQRRGKVRIGGEIFNILFHEWRGDKKEHSDESFFCFKIFKKGTMLINGLISIGQEDTVGAKIYNDKTFDTVAMLSIERNNEIQWRKKVEGCGAKLYEKMLDFLQNYSNDKKVKILHLVRKASVLDEIKWQNVFRPILEPRGYVAINDAASSIKWKKVYEPV